jgi:hypothetical protein
VLAYKYKGVKAAKKVDSFNAILKLFFSAERLLTRMRKSEQRRTAEASPLMSQFQWLTAPLRHHHLIRESQCLIPSITAVSVYLTHIGLPD